jgi:CheY-like chemotaxis protein
MMQILIIDNDHLPEISGDNIRKVTLKKPVDDKDSFDVWVSHQLTDVFSDGENYCLIVLPYSLSTENYMDYSGLRAAAHIRLTESWRHQRCPILFMGYEQPSFVARFSSLGDLLFTSYVFTTQDSLHSLALWEKYISDQFSVEMSDAQYQSFLDKIKVAAPENYGSHHTIANEWSVQRWSDMLQFPVEAADSNFRDLLFFKFLRARLGQPQRFTSKWLRENGNLCDMHLREGEHYRVAYIDDEYQKGWGSLLENIFMAANIGEFSYFQGFEEGISREELIRRIESYVDDTDADCYILDLRLHESDFDKDLPTDQLTGHEIARYIRKKNKANQIVIFSASDKVWNMKEDVMNIGAAGYVIKESPEMVYDRNQTYRNFADFLQEVLTACRQSYIKRYVSLLKGKDITVLDSFVDLLLLDKTESKTLVLSSLLLSLMVFIESYCKENFKIINDGKLYHNGNSDMIANISKKIRFHREIIDGKPIFTDVDCQETAILKDDWYNTYAIQDDKQNFSNMALIVAVLHYYFHFSKSLVNLILRARNQRNRNVAHNGNKIDMNITDVRKIFEDVVVRLINGDLSSSDEN